MTFADQLVEFDLLKLLKICVVNDLRARSHEAKIWSGARRLYAADQTAAAPA